MILDAPVVYEADRARVLTGGEPESLRAHQARLAALPRVEPNLLAVLDAIALAGRGGAHFSVATKWRTALAAGGGGVVVANGAEGEPASAKDAALLQHRPHLVLDGITCAATAIGADRAVLWLHEGAHETRRAIDRALLERRSAAVAGPTVELATGPDAYLSGESSAVVRALSGGPALPEFRRVPAATNGIGGRPTLVHNVETLARVALAARQGRHGYTDTTLVTVVAQGRRTVLEVDPRTTVAQAVESASNQAVPQAVLLGGYGGSWLPWAEARELPLQHQALKAAGAGLGAGIIAPLPENACGVTETAEVVDYLAHSSARQCGPCLFGLRAIADVLLELAQGEGSRAHLRRLRRYAGEVTGRGGCHHPDGAVRLVWTALATFEDDFAQHARKRRCLHHPQSQTAILPIPGRGAR